MWSWIWNFSCPSSSDSKGVQDQLHDVQRVVATYAAFAALRGDGSTITWGEAESGGDASDVQELTSRSIVKHFSSNFICDSIFVMYL